MPAATPLRTPAERDLIDLFSTGPATPLRLAAVSAFEASGLPHRRVEEYKYTDLRALIRAVPPRASAPAVEVAAIAATSELPADLAVKRLVFVDGMFQPALSDAIGLAGLSVRPLSEALDSVGALHPKKADPIIGLNTAGLGQGTVISIAPDAEIASPIEIAHVVSSATPVSVYLRHAITVGSGAKVKASQG